ncbi:hypothetical protein LT493_04865 [Streptomyces tricolor]|nr:hypothetical protein [Streptomyces tricolor]
MGSFQIPCSEQTRTWVARALAAVQIHDGSFHLKRSSTKRTRLPRKSATASEEPTWSPASNWPPASTCPPELDPARRAVAATLPAPPAPPRWYSWFISPRPPPLPDSSTTASKEPPPSAPAPA